MPLYEYDRSPCGDFTALRKIADQDAPGACPECGAQVIRVILTAPGLATLAGSTRRARPGDPGRQYLPRDGPERTKPPRTENRRSIPRKPPPSQRL